MATLRNQIKQNNCVAPYSKRLRWAQNLSPQLLVDCRSEPIFTALDLFDTPQPQLSLSSTNYTRSSTEVVWPCRALDYKNTRTWVINSWICK